MSIRTLMSVEEYLHTSFDGADREYLNGEAVERNVGNKSHGRAQGRIFFLIESSAERTGLFPVLELRHRVTQSRYRIPDIAVFAAEPAEEVPSSPPVAAVEVLSPDDRVASLLLKLEEYRQWGVAHIWVADPGESRLYVYQGGGLAEVDAFELPEHRLTLRKESIFHAS